MKRIIALVLCTVMLLTNLTVFADDLDFLFVGPKNYSADYSVSVTFDSPESIAALLEELQMPEQIEAFVDVKELLASLLSAGAEMNLKADMNEDYSKIRMSMTMDGDYGVTVNPNLSVAVDMKTGMWMDMDFSNLENPVMRVVYSYPILNKYLDCDLFEMIPEEQKLVVAALVRSFVNKNFVDEVSNVTKELYKKHADIKTSFNSTKIVIDNEGFTAIVDGLIPYFMSKISALFPAEAGVELPQLPSLSGLEILGEDGIVFEFNKRTGEIKCTTDISMSIADIYTTYSGEEWFFESKGQFDFTVVENGKIYDEGRTKVVFPELNEENSLTFTQFAELFGTFAMPEDEYYEEEFEYPYFYANAESDYMPDVNEDIYVPLRSAIEGAYDDNVAMSYSKGVVTMTSDYFTGFESISFKSGDDKVYVDGKEVSVGKIVIADGVTYVSAAFFERVFGWTLDYANFDIINGIYYFGFFTETW